MEKQIDSELFERMKRKNAALRAGLQKLECRNPDLARICFKEWFIQFGNESVKAEIYQGNPTAREIVRLWLKDNGFDGLVNTDMDSDFCGCQLSDFMPCGEWGSLCNCQAAYLCKDGLMRLEKEK